VPPPHSTHKTVPRTREDEIFTVAFYGLRIFGCKTAQLYDAHRKSTALDSALKYTLRKRYEKLRKN